MIKSTFFNCCRLVMALPTVVFILILLVLAIEDEDEDE